MAWLTNWQYRKKVTVSGSSGAGTNYQVLLKVGESSGATGADFHVSGHSSIFPSGVGNSGDLRFTASDETTLLDFYVEQVSGTTPNRIAYCWVEVAADLESNQDIYCYYGNSSATNVSNGGNTFLFFDNMEVWSGWTTKGSGLVSQNSTRAFEGTYSAYKTSYNEVNGAYKSIGATLGRNIALQFRVNRNSGYAGNGYDRVGLLNAGNNGYGWSYSHSTDKVYVNKRTNYSGTDYNGVSATDEMDSWSKAILKFTSSTIYAERYLSNGTAGGSTSYADTAYTDFNRVYIFGGYDYWVDQMFIRKYVSPEPAFSLVGTEETLSGGGGIMTVRTNYWGDL